VGTVQLIDTAASADDEPIALVRRPVPERRGLGWRPEVQGLRAIAVALVVLAHLWPKAVPGGYVGVDVFFAISGFLITSLLLEEVGRTGRVALGQFWARRARRILPAALMTLGVCAVATLLWVPESHWTTFLNEIGASAAYVENWQLAHSAADYFAAHDAVSPVQHYWSLSAEEQFYVVWPVAIGLALALTRRRSRPVRVRALALVMGALTAASLAWSIVHTPDDPAAAYFVTTTRAWEFGIGGLLALAPALGPRPHLRALLAWLGLAAIVVAGLKFSERTLFPGYAALLPIGGALAVMAAGAPAARWAPTGLLALRPIQWLGDVSYSVYLWHWPLLILIPYVVADIDDTTLRVATLVGTLVLAWVSKIVLEDPLRTAAFLVRARPARTFALAGAGTALVLAMAATGTAKVKEVAGQDKARTAKVVAAAPRCFGAAARPPDGGKPCDNPALTYTVVPTPVEAANSDNTPCQVIEKLGRVRACAFGAPADRAKGTIALVGDSHASHWRAAFDRVARDRGWHGLSVTHTGCPFSRAVAKLDEPERTQCVEWNRDTLRWFHLHPEITRVAVAQHTGGIVIRTPGRDNFATQMRGYRDIWAALPATVHDIVVIRDTPKIPNATLDCVAKTLQDGGAPGTACAVPRSRALEPDPAVAAARRWPSPRIRTIDLTGSLCDQRRCHPVVGGVLAFRDVDHLTSTFAATFAPYLERHLGAQA
jgi:peptidoglycan/LPS O-acetylase OafA/YrhL